MAVYDKIVAKTIHEGSYDDGIDLIAISFANHVTKYLYTLPMLLSFFVFFAFVSKLFADDKRFLIPKIPDNTLVPQITLN